MYFDFKIDEEPISDYIELVERIAIRGIIIHEDKLLLVETNKGDLKFPGGGIHNSETFEECIIREVKEETGYIE